MDGHAQAACAKKILCPKLIFDGQNSGEGICSEAEILAIPDEKAVMAMFPGISPKAALATLVPLCKAQAAATKTTKAVSSSTGLSMFALSLAIAAAVV